MLSVDSEETPAAGGSGLAIETSSAPSDRCCSGTGTESRGVSRVGSIL